jgi:hypothetical protein
MEFRGITVGTTGPMPRRRGTAPSRSFAKAVLARTGEAGGARGSGSRGFGGSRCVHARLLAQTTPESVQIDLYAGILDPPGGAGQIAVVGPLRRRPARPPIRVYDVTVSVTRSVVVPTVRSEVIRAGITYTPATFPSAW